MPTRLAKPGEVERRWIIVDCAGKPVGRLATQIADILRGKTKPIYTPHADTGDFVVAINASSITLTGRKMEQKRYWRHSGYPGGISSDTAAELKTKSPEEIIRHAVKGMLPKNTLSRSLLAKLKIYAGSEHPHKSQNPQGI